jgi:predicted nucleotidyltransferase component of viral defense system
MAETSGPLPLEDEQQFSAALSYTAAQTGFIPRLIEKDYFCSIILRELRPLFESGLVFKGGTALSKVHASFHRLSEDLDFMISMKAEAAQADRRAAIKEVKEYLQGMAARLPWLRELTPLTGANRSTQYNGTYAYTSLISGEPDTIKIEIALREPVLDGVEWRDAATILMEPLSGTAALAPIPVVALSVAESYAEKIRAALSRRDPAIRDLFDLHHAIESRILDVNSASLLALARRKLLVNPDEPSNVSEERLEVFRAQVETALRPVLRQEDFERFDIERVLTLLLKLDQGFR